MARTDEPVKITSRPPWIEPRAPFWKHQFVGGNAFMLQMLADHGQEVEANASARQFKPLIEQARDQLRKAARLHVQGKRDGGNVVLRVEVENLAGHKFPTGHPYRRAWLHVRVTDQQGQTLFESGAVDSSGALRGAPGGHAPHRDLITRPEEVQIYQSVMADAQGEPTWLLLRGATYFKDNRIPPRGFVVEDTDASHVAVGGGAESDPNFNHHGSGCDEVTYRVAVGAVNGPLVAEVELLYQSVPPEAVAHVLSGQGPAAMEFKTFYATANKMPETVHRVRCQL
jgi:hypothetical protein